MSARISFTGLVIVRWSASVVGCGSDTNATFDSSAELHRRHDAGSYDARVDSSTSTSGSSSDAGAEADAAATTGDAGPSGTWAGLIDPKRAIDWTQAGLPHGLPDSNWTQCLAALGGG
jgi:hypothetical protein